MPSLNLGAMSAVPRELVPSAAGTLNFIRMTGAAIGVNALAIVIDSRLATHLQSFVATQTAGNVRLAELRSEAHTSDIQSLMRTSYAVLCLTNNKKHTTRS